MATPFPQLEYDHTVPQLLIQPAVEIGEPVRVHPHLLEDRGVELPVLDGLPRLGL